MDRNNMNFYELTRSQFIQLKSFSENELNDKVYNYLSSDLSIMLERLEITTDERGKNKKVWVRYLLPSQKVKDILRNSKYGREDIKLQPIGEDFSPILPDEECIKFNKAKTQEILYYLNILTLIEELKKQKDKQDLSGLRLEEIKRLQKEAKGKDEEIRNLNKKVKRLEGQIVKGEDKLEEVKFSLRKPVGAKSQWTPFAEKWYELYMSGDDHWTIKKIANMFGASPITVKSQLKKYSQGNNLPLKENKPRKVKEKKTEE